MTLGSDVTSSGIAALANLEHLQEFSFREIQTERRPVRYPIFSRKIRTNFYSTCLQLIPKLEICGARIEFPPHEEIHEEIPLYAQWDDDVSRIVLDDVPRQLKLKQLALRRPSRMPKDLHLPNLETLYVLQPIQTFRFDETFPYHNVLTSLTELVVTDINQEHFDQLAKSVGHRLRKLSISMPEEMVIDRVFRMCPNVQVLYLVQSNNFSPFTKGAVMKSLVGCDLSGIVELAIVNEYKTEPLFNADHLMKILKAAPNLRILRLEILVFYDKNVKAICKVLKQRSILQQLEELHFLYTWDDYPSEDELQLQRNCFSVIRSMILLCPKLICVTEWNLSRAKFY